MRFTRYPKGEPYQTTPRKLAFARRAVRKEKDRYPLFPELLKHQTAEDRLASIAVVERETWWQEMRQRQAKLWRKARQALRDLPAGPRAAIKRCWKICGCPGDPVYLLTIIHEHRARKVCYWHAMAELRRLRLRFKQLGADPIPESVSGESKAGTVHRRSIRDLG
jgi:hypothetical protein